MAVEVQTVVLAGQRFVILPEGEYQRLTGRGEEPPLPSPDANGNYPAVVAGRVLLARDILRGRRAAGLTQVELARLAGIRPETLNRIEKGKHTPTVATVEKIDRVLSRATDGR
jgi:DNA-binding XRE family transcriptional regulator